MYIYDIIVNCSVSVIVLAKLEDLANNRARHLVYQPSFWLQVNGDQGGAVPEVQAEWWKTPMYHT